MVYCCVCRARWAVPLRACCLAGGCPRLEYYCCRHSAVSSTAAAAAAVSPYFSRGDKTAVCILFSNIVDASIPPHLRIANRFSKLFFTLGLSCCQHASVFLHYGDTDRQRWLNAGSNSSDQDVMSSKGLAKGCAVCLVKQNTTKQAKTKTDRRPPPLRHALTAVHC